MKYVWLCLVLICLTFFSQASFAQSGLTLGENTLDELTFEQPILTYSFTAQDETPLTLEAQSLTSDFAAMLMIYDSEGKLLQQEINPLAASKVRLLWTPIVNTTYQIRVMGVNGGFGQFILSLNPSLAPLPPANELQIDTILEDRVTLAAPIIRYQLAADRSQALILRVTSLLPQGGMGVILTDLEGQIQAITRYELGGGAFIIPAAVDVGYELWIVHSGADQLEGFQLTLSRLNTTAGTPEPDTTTAIIETTPEPTLTTESQVIIPFDGPCAVTSASATGVNIRRGPATEFDIVSGLTNGEILTVTGRDQSARWWQVEYETGLYGWVVDTAVRRGGDCTGVGFVLPPPLPNNTASPTEEIISPTATSEGN